MASIQKRGANSFLLVVEIGYSAKGKRLKRTKTIHVNDPQLLKKKKKLNEYLNDELTKFKIEVEAGEYIAPEKMVLSEFVKEWEKKYAKEALSGGTLNNYLSNFKNHIEPVLGDLRLDQIKTIHIVNLLNNLKRTDGNGESSIHVKQYTYRVIRNIMSRAYEWKLVKNNPVDGVKKPRNKDEEMHKVNVYDEEEVEQLFLAVQSEPIHWRIFTSLALAGGLRKGELLGLEVSKINFDEQTIEIDQTIVMGENNKPEIKSTKTKKSARLVSLPKTVMDELKFYVKYLEKEKEKMGDAYEQEHQWLFCNEYGHHLYPTTPSKWWSRFVKKAGVRHIRLHDLRHTSATLLINQGVHAKIISERLGHADIGITMDTYGHALRTADKSAAEKLDTIFRSKNQKESNRQQSVNKS